MLSREEFEKRFGRRAIFGMVHLEPLPGAPLFGGSIDAVIAAAQADANALAAGGCDGIVFENFGDRPFYKHAGAETIAAMARVIADIAPKLPFGVNVLRNDAHSALAIAAATGAGFIRINVHTGTMATDQGIIEGEAAETLRYRAVIAPDVLIFADFLVKHASPVGGHSARDLRERGLADAIVVSGAETGAAADVHRLAEVRRSVDAPILIGSGLTAENARDYADADGAIVGTSLKTNGRVDAARVERVARAFKQPGGR
jgi:membrane complex biogenesis BtpA family protein